MYFVLINYITSHEKRYGECKIEKDKCKGRIDRFNNIINLCYLIKESFMKVN